MFQPEPHSLTVNTTEDNTTTAVTVSSSHFMIHKVSYYFVRPYTSYLEYCGSVLPKETSTPRDRRRENGKIDMAYLVGQ